MWEEFKTVIHCAFGEIDAKEIAKVKFNKIEQGARSTALYWAEFQNIIADLDYCWKCFSRRPVLMSHPSDRAARMEYDLRCRTIRDE